MNPYISTIVVAVIFFVLGAALVGILWYFKGVSARTKAGSKDSTPDDANLSEVVRLMRHLQTQELVVQMDGKNFDKPVELSAAQHRRVRFTSNVLAKWLEQPGPKPSAEENTGVESTTSPAVIDDAVEPKPGYTPPFAPEDEQVKPVSTSFPDVVSGILTPAPTPTPAFKSVAMQINDILQSQLAGTPLDSRGITLTDAPNGGVTVTLDGKQYDGPMNVPDHEVRNAIRLAVKEWETKR